MDIPGMVMIGGTARHCGKTGFACYVIDRYKYACDITAVKTSIFDAESLEYEPYWGTILYTDPESRVFLTEDMNAPAGKDTGRMRDAGAKRVLWLHAVYSQLELSAKILKDVLGPGTVSVCESTGLRAVVEPDVFILVHSKETQQVKPTAQNVMHHADIITAYNNDMFTPGIEILELDKGRWRKRRTKP
jgi:hypothetical protein